MHEVQYCVILINIVCREKSDANKDMEHTYEVTTRYFHNILDIILCSILL